VQIPADLKYTKEHEWLRLSGNTATIGITDYAQGELGDIVFIELPSVGASVAHMQPFGTIEAVKAVSEMFSPVTGKVIDVNTALENDPAVVNRDPYGDGWIMKVEVSDTSHLEQLLDAGGYRSQIGE
jgi:glycine cleavage system H protein